MSKLIVIDNGQLRTAAQAPAAAPVKRPTITRERGFGFAGGYVVHKIQITKHDGEIVSMKAACGSGKGKEVRLVEGNCTTCIRCGGR